MQALAVTLTGLAKIGEAIHRPGDTIVVTPTEAFQLADADAIPPLTDDELVDLLSPTAQAAAAAPAAERDDLLERLSAAEGRAATAEAALAEARGIVGEMQARIAELEREIAASAPDAGAPIPQDTPPPAKAAKKAAAKES